MKKNGNRLGDTTSPYLLQHKDNPVHWYPWGDEAFHAARAQDRPILLSIGYAACHWCHVMAHESFENPATAEAMNRLFINIKVDREERPDLDAIYQQALALLGQQGGWPLTMFLSPDAKPFWGGTYFPPESRWGRPGFPEVLAKIAEIYRQETHKVASNSQELMAAMVKLAQPRPGEAIATDMLDRIAARLLEEVDWQDGGIGKAPKFPQFPILELLWRAYIRTGIERYKDAVVKSLRHLCQGGIYDHLGGGMARYSVDAQWLVPHFEKMLYDNASLLAILALVQPHMQDPLFKVRAEELVSFLTRDMPSEEQKGVCAFASSWDADSEGHEGKYYVWQKAEIEKVLGGKAEIFCCYYSVTEDGNWEGSNILNRLAHLDWLGDEEEEALHRMRESLRLARQSRVKPGFDDKVLADWNGIAITALCQAGISFGQPAWIERAKAAYRFLKDQHFLEGKLHHSWRQGKVGALAMLDDQAQMAAASIALYEVSGEEFYLNEATARLKDLDKDYWDQEKGGYFNSSVHARDIILRQKSAFDGATPNGNGLMLALLMRLWQLTGEDFFKDRALVLEKAFAGEIEKNFAPLATYLNAVDFIHSPLLIVILGEKGERQDFLNVLKKSCHPNMILQLIAPGQEISPDHPAYGKTAMHKKAVFLCKGQTCSLPIFDAEAMEQALKDSYR